MRGACRDHGKDKFTGQNWSRTSPSGDAGVDRKIILKWILNSM
jgi:hypothetical protein